MYISLDIGLGITTLIGGVSNPPEALRSIALFILTSILPAVWVFIFASKHRVAEVLTIYLHRAALLYLVIMSYIVLQVLEETRPMWYYILATCLFVLSQLAWFLLGRVICKVTCIFFDLLLTWISWYFSLSLCRALIREWMVLSLPLCWRQQL